MVRYLFRAGKFVAETAGMNINIGINMNLSMGIGVVLAALMPQVSLAQEQTPASRQHLKHARKAEQRLAFEEKAQKMSMASHPKSVEVVNAVPKLNEKRLSAEELRELRIQLFQQR